MPSWGIIKPNMGISIYPPGYTSLADASFPQSTSTRAGGAVWHASPQLLRQRGHSAGHLRGPGKLPTPEAPTPKTPQHA